MLFEYFAAELLIGGPDAVEIDVLDGKENNTVLTNCRKPLNSSRTIHLIRHIYAAPQHAAVTTSPNRLSDMRHQVRNGRLPC